MSTAQGPVGRPEPGAPGGRRRRPGRAVGLAAGALALLVAGALLRPMAEPLLHRLFPGLVPRERPMLVSLVPAPASAPSPSGAAAAGAVEDRIVTINHLRLDLVRLEARVADLEKAGEDQASELTQARAEADSYRQGLERAVDELNRLRQAVAADRASRVPPQVVREAVEPLGGAQVTVTRMGWVVVSGYVHNNDGQGARGDLEVSLLGGGGVIDSKKVLLDVPPGGDARYDLTFYGVNPVGPLAASVRWLG